MARIVSEEKATGTLALLHRTGMAGHQIAFSAKFGASSSRPTAYAAGSHPRIIRWRNYLPSCPHSLRERHLAHVVRVKAGLALLFKHCVNEFVQIF